MFGKILAISALLGCSSALSVFTWTETDKIVENDWFKMYYDAEGDYGYGTHWYKMPADKPNYKTTEKYGAHFYSTIKVNIRGYAAKVREYNAEYEFVPLWFAPYEQEYTWYRYGDGNGANEGEMEYAGLRDLQLLDFYTTYTENMKTLKVSLHDYVEDKRDSYEPEDADWDYREEYEVEWEDSYWGFNLLEELDVDTSEWDWYGSHEYYREYYN